MPSLPHSSSPEDLIRTGWRFDRLVKAIETARLLRQSPLNEDKRLTGWTKKRKKVAVGFVEGIASAVEERTLDQHDDFRIGSEWGRKGSFRSWHFSRKYNSTEYNWKGDEWKDAVYAVSETADCYVDTGERVLRKILLALETIEDAGRHASKDGIQDTCDELNELVPTLQHLAEQLLHGDPVSRKDSRDFHDAVLPLGASHSWFDPAQYYLRYDYQDSVSRFYPIMPLDPGRYLRRYGRPIPQLSLYLEHTMSSLELYCFDHPKCQWTTLFERDQMICSIIIDILESAGITPNDNSSTSVNKVETVRDMFVTKLEAMGIRLYDLLPDEQAQKGQREIEEVELAVRREIDNTPIERLFHVPLPWRIVADVHASLLEAADRDEMNLNDERYP